MMDQALNLDHFIQRAASIYPNQKITTRLPDGSYHYSNYHTVYQRSRKLCSALLDLGIQAGDRVATLMWNHYAHLENYFAIPAIGAVLHTLNLRLHADEIAYIAEHAEDKILLVDDVLLPLCKDILSQYRFEKIIVFNFSGKANTYPELASFGIEIFDYKQLLEKSSPIGALPAIAEHSACGMCYTSGTTGKPKGVLYSQRSSVLHAMGFALPDSANLSQTDVILPVVPMFHAMAWGLPYAATMVGAALALPGEQLDAENVLDLMHETGTTFAGGVPTIWMRAIEGIEQQPERWQLRANLRLFVGGSATPPALIERFRKIDINLQCVWGMTETSPIASVVQLRPEFLESTPEETLPIRASAGIALPFVETRIVDDQKILENNGESVGELQVRGPWITGSYYRRPDSADAFTDDGWFCTGDVASIRADGYIIIRDRSKDLIKSGGEWISSVELENAIMAVPDIAEAAVIAIPDDKWMERPLAIVVTKSGEAPNKDKINQQLLENYPKWWLPSDYVQIDKIPKTSTGKFKKLSLRERFAG